MFHFKDILSRVAHGQSPNSPARTNEPDTAEGFLCPLCMQAFTTQEELQVHYSASHKDFEPPPATPSNNEEVNVFQSFHQGVGDKYKQSQQPSTDVEEAKESLPESNSTDIQKEIGEISPELTIQELMKKLKDLIKQNELIAEEKRQVEQRAASLAEKVVTLKATADEGESEMAALTNRLAVVEAQLAHRENIDDAAVLRQELIQVQRFMDEMTREREMESDQLKRDLQNLQQKYDLLESESERMKNMEEDMKSKELLEESLLKKDELIAKLSDELTMLKETVSTLENESFQKSSKLNKTEVELENSKLMLDKIHSKEEENRKRIKELEERLVQNALALEESKKQPMQLNELIIDLKENARKDAKTISDLKLEISNHLNEISSKNKELTLVHEKVEMLNSQLKEFTIMNEDLRCRNAEQARYLDDKMKLVTSLEDKEKEIKCTLEKNAAQMDLLNKNYLELMNLFQAQMHENNKMDSDTENKLLSQIESAVDLLTKKSNELDHLSSNDKQLFESLQKEGKSTNEEVIKMLQAQCKEKSEQLIDAQRRINILSNEIEGKASAYDSIIKEFESIINSLRQNLEQRNTDLSERNEIVGELEDKIVVQKSLVAQKEEELSRINSMYNAKVEELKKVRSLSLYLKKELEFCKETISSMSNELKRNTLLCKEKIISMSVLYAQVELEAKELLTVKEELKIASVALIDKDDTIQGMMKKLEAEQKKNSELQDMNSIKLMEIEELNSHIALEKKHNAELIEKMEVLMQQQSELKEHVNECESKVKSLTSDLLSSEKQKADVESEKEILEAKMKADLHEKEMVIQEFDQAKQMLLKQQIEVKKTMEAMETNYQQELNNLNVEIEQLKSTIAKEESQNEELKKTLEEEMLAKTGILREFSLFKTRHETDITIYQDSIKSLTNDLNVREESEKTKEKTIEKLQELNSNMKTEWEMERQALLERYIESTKENERLQSATNDLRRRLEDSQAALHEIGRENQTYQMELAKLSGRKWTEDSDVTNCVKCAKEFSIRVRKHHCRNCGQIFCSDCSSKMAAIASNKKPVRVCDACYTELVPN